MADHPRAKVRGSSSGVCVHCMHPRAKVIMDLFITRTPHTHREKEGRCVSNMMAKEATMNELGRHVQTFHKQEQFSSNR